MGASWNFTRVISVFFGIFSFAFQFVAVCFGVVMFFVVFAVYYGVFCVLCCLPFFWIYN